MNTKVEHIEQRYLEYVSGLLSEEDKASLRNLLEEDAEYRQIWDELCQEDEMIGLSHTLADIDVPEQLRHIKKSEHKQKGKQQPLRIWMAIAASLVFFIALTYVLWPIISGNGTQIPQQISAITLFAADGKQVKLSDPATDSSGAAPVPLITQILKETGEEKVTGWNTLLTPAGLNYKMALSDGTIVSLNVMSKLMFPASFDGNANREVYLEGEAFFEVAPDAARPFIVKTANGRINVLGTSFNVNAYEKEVMMTSLVSGTIKVNNLSGDSVVLQPGSEAFFTQGKAIEVKPFDVDNKLAWMKGVLYFYDMPLSELETLLPRWYGAKVQFQYNALRELRVSGLLNKNNLPAFLENICKSAHINYRLKGKEVYIFQ